MKLTELLLADLEREAAATRKAIEQMPEGRNDWKPHEKSMPFGYLASLVATMPAWVKMIIDTDHLDLGAGGGSEAEFSPKAAGSTRELLEMLEKSAAAGREALKSTTDAHLLGAWQFRMGGQTLREDARHVMISESVFSHLAHHRGQLTVYLRLNDAKVPAIYGPSADERPFS